MKKLISAATGLAAAALAVTAGAANQNRLAGSDTLAALTNKVLLVCDTSSVGTPVGTPLDYIGGGSSNGEQAMLNKDSAGLQTAEQEIAPMSRALQAPRTCRSAHPELAEGKVIGLDALAIIGTTTDNVAACSGVAFEATNCFTVTDVNHTGAVDCAAGSCPGNQYCFAPGTANINPVFDALRLVYFGLDHNGVRDCNSDTRRSLVDTWSNTFIESCPTPGTCTSATPALLAAVVPGYPPAVPAAGPIPTTMPNLASTFAQNNGLIRALRRGDLSGTTDTFVAIVTGGALSITGQRVNNPARPAFCNGSDVQDGDPIRRRCNAQDAVCGTNAHSGLVQAITVDEKHPAATIFPSRQCTRNAFALLPARQITKTDFTTQFECPERENFSIGGFCFTAVVSPSTKTPPNAAGDSDCWNPSQNPAATQTDGRVNNRYVRGADGSGPLVENGILTNAESTQNGFFADVVNAYFRVRQNTIVPPPIGGVSTLGAAVCQQLDSTDQIGCLMGQIRCSVAFAGMSAATVGGVALSVGGIAPSDATVQPLGCEQEGQPNPAGTYPIARRLFLNSMDSLVAVVDGKEDALQQCFYDSALMAGPAGIVRQSKFIELPTPAQCAGLGLGTTIDCTPFNEMKCNTQGKTCTTNADCPNNYTCISGACGQACTAAADCGVWGCAAGACNTACTGADQAAADAVCTAKQPASHCVDLTGALATTGHCGFTSNSANTCL